NLDDPRGTRRGHVAATRAPADDGGPRLLAGVPLGSHGPADGRPEGPHGPVSGASTGGAAVSFLREEGRPADRDGTPGTRGDFGILNGSRFGDRNGDGPPEGHGPAPRRRSDRHRGPFRGPVRACLHVPRLSARVRPDADGSPKQEVDSARGSEAPTSGGGRGPRTDEVPDRCLRGPRRATIRNARRAGGGMARVCGRPLQRGFRSVYARCLLRGPRGGPYCRRDPRHALDGDAPRRGTRGGEGSSRSGDRSGPAGGGDGPSRKSGRTAAGALRDVGERSRDRVVPLAR